MRPQTIGPLPLSDGLQLSPPEGKPSGLYRALNVEARDGFCQTRRGQGLRGMVLNGAGALVNPGLAQVSPVIGGTVFFLGVDGALNVPTPDTFLCFQQGFGGAGGDLCEDGVTVEFWGADDAWHQVDIVTSYGGGFSIQASTIAIFIVLVPYGWKKAIAPGGPVSSAYWLRFTKNNAGTWTDTCSFTGEMDTPDDRPLATSACDAVVAGPATRTGKGPFCAIRIGSGLGLAAVPYVPTVWNIFDLSKKPTFGVNTYSYTQGLLSSFYTASGYVNAAENDLACYAYVPQADHILWSLGSKFYDHDVSAGTIVEFAPATAEQYADIGTESSVPTQPRAMCMFGGRVFVAGFPADPQGMGWSAPEEFWQTWPSANLAHIDGGGQIQALIPVAESLFIFTSTGIWRAFLSDPTDGNESDLLLSSVEETPCVSRRSVVAVGKSIVFLSNDGVRVFDGQRSKLLTSDVRDLFRPDSEHPFACRRPEVAVACWHRTENQYRLSYPMSGSQHHDCMLVVDLDDKTCWLWGADPPSALETGVITPSLGVIAQRGLGVRLLAMGWDTARQCIVGILPQAAFVEMDNGPTDLGQKFPWYAESQTLRISQGQRAILSKAELEIARDHFQPFSISVIPDGDRARTDTKSVSAEPDRLATTAAIGSQSLAGNMTPLQLDGAIVPLRARFRLAGRNHRVRIQSLAPNHDAIRAMAFSVDLSVDDRSR